MTRAIALPLLCLLLVSAGCALTPPRPATRILPPSAPLPRAAPSLPSSSAHVELPDEHDEPGGHGVAPARTDALSRALAEVSGEEVARDAAKLVGSRAGRDCVDFVRRVYRRHGVDLFAEGGAPGDNGVRIVWRLAKRRSAVHRGDRPRAGDLVFFDDTHDRNADGRRNDRLTHVGIVEQIDEFETVTFIHRVARGVVRSKLNLTQPGVRQEGGVIRNDYVRVGTGRGHGPRLAGSLFTGYATVAGP